MRPAGDVQSRRNSSVRWCCDVLPQPRAFSSAAQASVNLDALAGGASLDDMAAYARSKLALTQWTRHMAQALGDRGPVIVAVHSRLAAGQQDGQ